MEENKPKYNINITPIINSVNNNFGRFDNFFKTHNAFNDFHHKQLFRAIEVNPKIFSSVPSPLSPKFTSKNINKNKVKVREIIKIPLMHDSVPFLIPFLDAGMQANDLFEYDISKIMEPPQIINIPSSDSSKNWFWDLDKVVSKLTVICQLSKPDEYEGGDHKIRLGKNILTLPKEQYDTVVFPSFALQKLEPITKGNRQYIMAYIGSQNYR